MNFRNKKNTGDSYLEHSQGSLLKFVLYALFAIGILYAVINFIFKSHEHYIAIGVLEIAVSAISLAILFYYRKTKKNYQVTIITISLMTVVLVAFFALAGSGRYAFYWICVYPPVVYFLLERKKANIIVGLYCAYMFFFMISAYVSWDSDEVKVSSIINILGATAGLIFLIRYFNISRKEAENALEEKNNELKGLIITDYLTGLYNRIKLDDVLHSELKKASTGASTFSIIMADIDNFKKINDTYGHLTGDSVLIDVAQVLKKWCNDNTIVGRWGGEEFLIVCPQKDILKTKVVCEEILCAISKYKYSIGEAVTLSFGITEHLHNDSIDALLSRADKALYHAKERGKSRIETKCNN